MMFRWCLLIFFSFSLFSVFSAQGGGGDCYSLLAGSGMPSVRLKYSFRIPQGRHDLISSAEIDDRLILMDRRGDSPPTNRNFIRFFNKEGEVKGQFQEKPQSVSEFSPYPSTRGSYITPVEGERIVVASTLRDLIYTFDKNGRLINKVVTDSLIDHAPVKLKKGRSLAVSRLGTVYVINQDGALLHKFKINRFPGGSVSFLPMSDGGVVIGQGRSRFYFVNEEGILKNEAKIGRGISSKAKLVGSKVAILDISAGSIHYFDQYRGLLRNVIDLKHNKVKDRFSDIALTSTGRPVAALDSGEVAFFDKSGNRVSQVLVEEGAWMNISLISDDAVLLTVKNRIYFLDENGKITKLMIDDGGIKKSPPIIVNNKVVVLSDDGYLYLFNKDGKLMDGFGHSKPNDYPFLNEEAKDGRIITLRPIGHIERILNVNNSIVTVLERREAGDYILSLEVQ